MRRNPLILAAIAAAAASGCGEEPGAGGVTAEESRQLDEAAAMLEDEPDEAAPAPAE